MGVLGMRNTKSNKAGLFFFGVLVLIISLVVIGCAGIQYQQSPSIYEITQKWRDKADEEHRQIIADLQQGGYVIFLRHAKTDWLQKDIEPFDFTHCEGQRNLSDEGRAQAVKIGEAYRALTIPIGEVISSPFCRCKDTAELAFGSYRIEKDLQHIPYKDNRKGREQMEYLWDRLDEMLAQLPPPGKNTVLVGHSPNLIRNIDIRSLPEGNTVVYKPDGKGSFEYIGMIWPEELFRLY